MKLSLKKIWQDNFSRGTLILTVVSIGGAALNYLVHPILTRRLSVTEYGDFQALLSFVTILVFVGAVIQTTLTKEIALLKDTNEGAISILSKRVTRTLWLVGVVVFIVVAFSAPSLTHFFNINSQFGIILVSAILMYLAPLLVNRAILTGLQRFSDLSLSTFLEPAFRLLLIVLLVIVWPLRLTGAAIALGGTSLLAFIISYFQIKKLNLARSTNNPSFFKPVVSYGLLVLWFTVLTQFFFNFDILFVKANFDAQSAGLYGALLTIGRIIFFIGSAIPLAMFPVIANLKKDTSLKKFKVFVQAMGFSLILTVPIASFIAFFPELTIRIIVGAKYLSMASYLPLMTVVFFLETILIVVGQYFLALSRRLSLVYLSFGVLAEIIFLIYFHHTIPEIIFTLIFIFGILDILLFILFIKDYQRASLALRN